LECQSLAAADEIKKAYRKLAISISPPIKPHPPDNPALRIKFKEAAELRSLSNPLRKSKDMIKFGQSGRGGGRGYVAGGMNMEDIFSQFVDIFGERRVDGFGSFFSGGSGG